VALVLLALLAGAAGMRAAQMPRPDPGRQVIYELNTRQFTREGTLAAAAQHLPRLRALGVDIVWLMPVFPIGVERRKGELGSPYSVRDYRAVNPELGTLADLRNFTRQAHALGQQVILDWVANHCAWDNPLVKEHPDWLTRDAAGLPQPPVPDWSDVVDLDYARPELRAWMVESMAFWLREAEVDGFRCDVAGMLPTDFWQEACPRLQALRPLFMLAEWEDPALAGPFQMSYGWNLYRGFNACMKGEATVARLDSLLRAEESIWPAGHRLMRFTTNHDENSWNGTEDERLGPAADAFSVLCWTLPGLPLIYNGQEAGLERRLSFFAKDSIVWREHSRRALFEGLNRLKHTSPALWRDRVAADSYRRLPVKGSPALWAFLRPDARQDLLCAVNLSAAPAKVTLRDPALRGHWREWEDGRLSQCDGSLELSLPAWGWSIWRHAAE
jgi:glycosidase